MAEETARLEKEEAKEKPKASKLKPTKPRELNYVMVQHMGYAAETRAHRHIRPGGRKQRIMLDNGRRLRAKGDRYTEVTFSDVLANFNTLLGGVRNGTIQVCRPDNLQAVTLEQFLDLGERLSEDFKKDLKVDETLLEPLVGSDLKDRKAWVTKPKDADVTNPDMGQSELMAKVDQHEAEAKGEANPPPDTGLLDDQGQPAAAEGAEGDTQLDAGAEGESAEGDGEGGGEESLTEEQMMAMSVKDLQKLAKEYKVKKPEKIHAKKDLVDAIMEAASKEQE
jgi:hypothetical protein